MSGDAGDALDVFLRREPVDAVEQMKAKLTHMSERLDQEIKRSEEAHRATSPPPGGDEVSAAVASTQMMRVVERWMRHKDLEEVLLRRTALTDESFGTLVHCLMQSPSLHTLDLSENELTIASVSDLAQLLTMTPDLTMVSVARNALPLSALGYLMAAMLERQAKGLTPPVLINLQNTQGLADEENHGTEALAMQERCANLCSMKVSMRSANLLVMASRALWQFLADTGHPLLDEVDSDKPAWGKLDQVTHGKFLEALRPMVLCEEEINDEPRSISAWLAIAEEREVDQDVAISVGDEAPDEARVMVEEPVAYFEPAAASTSLAKAGQQILAGPTPDPLARVEEKTVPAQEVTRRQPKAKQFNLKQVVTKHGMILMNILERLLETTAIDATDVETGKTLLEFASETGNMALAKLCYRRGMNMSAQFMSDSAKGATALTIATRQKNYGLMEFLHTYGVKVNSADSEGRTALHWATRGNDIDGVCRLVEWGADINLRDHQRRTALHHAAMCGHTEVAMLLLELGADLNARDAKDYTPVAQAEASDNFALMDRLIQLGGRQHQPDRWSRDELSKLIGQVSQPKFMRQSTSLTRLKKFPLSLP